MEELCAIEGKSLIKIVLEESIPFQGYIIYMYVYITFHYYLNLLNIVPITPCLVCTSVCLFICLSICLSV